MYQLLHDVQDKWNIKFPLLANDPYNFDTSTIILNKEKVLEFMADMKLNKEKLFEKTITKENTKKDTSFEILHDDTYIIKDILPTEFADLGTFRVLEFPLDEASNGTISMKVAAQKIYSDNIEKAWLNKLLSNIQLTCMHDDLV